MSDLSKGGLENGWDDVVKIYSKPTERGYASDDVFPNLFLSNHDGFRLADHFYDQGEEINVMTRYAILAGIPTVTMYYGDEFGDLSRDAAGSQTLTTPRAPPAISWPTASVRLIYTIMLQRS